MICGRVQCVSSWKTIFELVRALERFEGRRENEIVAWHVVGFAMTLRISALVGTQELVGQFIPRVGIANARRLLP